MANASKDLLIQLSMSFVTSLSAKANVVCGEHGKKTIFPEHVFESLHAQKQSGLLAPVLGTVTFGKMSFNKQKDHVLMKLNSSEFQQRKQRDKGNSH